MTDPELPSLPTIIGYALVLIVTIALAAIT
jgi:hypothetical protein